MIGVSSREEKRNERPSSIAARSATAFEEHPSSIRPKHAAPRKSRNHFPATSLEHSNALAADGRKTSQRDLPEEAHDPTRDPRTMASQAAANALTNLARAAVGIGFAGSALSASMYDGACL